MQFCVLIWNYHSQKEETTLLKSVIMKGWHPNMESLQYITVTPNTSECINLADQYNKQEHKHLLWIGFMSSLKFLLFLDVGLIVLQYSTFGHPFIPAASHIQCSKTYSIILWQGCKHRLKWGNICFHSVQNL
jgi:hypothetical protein